MFIKEFKCECCGNNDPKKAYYYDGCLGYEAIVCQCCGTYYDHYGVHDLDEFSLNYVNP